MVIFKDFTVEGFGDFRYCSHCGVHILIDTEKLECPICGNLELNIVDEYLKEADVDEAKRYLDIESNKIKCNIPKGIYMVGTSIDVERRCFEDLASTYKTFSEFVDRFNEECGDECEEYEYYTLEEFTTALNDEYINVDGMWWISIVITE